MLVLIEHVNMPLCFTLSLIRAFLLCNSLHVLAGCRWRTANLVEMDREERKRERDRERGSVASSPIHYASPLYV